jgi:hypothetical protein
MIFIANSGAKTMRYNDSEDHRDCARLWPQRLLAAGAPLLLPAACWLI